MMLFVNGLTQKKLEIILLLMFELSGSAKKGGLGILLSPPLYLDES